MQNKRTYLAIKRVFDVAFSVVAIAGFWWLYLLIGVAIKLDDPSGPAIYRQWRVGKNDMPFVMYKFRSMYVDADARKAELSGLNERSGPVFKIHDDPRVTRVGRFLRRHSLDELPQFVNVFKGDLSVVGPRPALPEEIAGYTSRQRIRLTVQPGLTCYWQVTPDRDDVPFDEWMELDLRYVRERSVLVDLKLIAKTVLVIVQGEGS